VFIDEVVVHLRAGDGGAGVVAFKRERGKPRGRPEGGSGGAGGDVIVEADPAIATLLEYRRRPHRRASAGTHGKGDLQHGKRGEDLVLGVPPGTVVRDADGTIIADLARPGQRVTLLEGGRPGRGNAALVGPRHLAPGFAEQGEYGESADFTLELKLAADAAIVGFPNAGKSTLIARVSAARPKIADYPFTTIEPHLGVVDIDDRQFVLADIPGLIEGASEGKGLGHRFLRHVERARALLVLLDPSPLQEHSVAEQLGILRAELEAGESLSAAGIQALTMSSVTGVGVDEVMHAVADAVAASERLIAGGEGFVLHRPLPLGFAIHRHGEQWVVTGKAAERAVAFDDLTKPEAADVASRRLRRAGIDDELRRLGARPGDEVVIGDLVFEFADDDPFPGP
jgi:GTP-binding protein